MDRTIGGCQLPGNSSLDEATRVIVFLLEALGSCWDVEFLAVPRTGLSCRSGCFDCIFQVGGRGGTCTDRRAAEQEVIIDDGLVNFLLPVECTALG